MNKGERDDINLKLLSERIEQMRDELVNIGFLDGLTAPTTIKYSKLLDEKIETFQKIIKEK
ncbi:Spo0E like sporulation regulatory protein [Gracilibacillus orientalis]|uniref:Spo0E like sporulation regulatory protein n=1 Tax=Gracilibacillus orientalis TaxID=334253 RepID=A0A1I4GT97_9BACI|nr:aspartyl-phosphate phosphatase Spo0E family protein [Gracilibacillus orientalis]SFL33238.1 Spo0E like sporulation regulatory protein [Gracilibacillus orientalis]